MVHAWCIYTVQESHDTLYLLAGVGCQALPGSCSTPAQAMTSLVRTSTWISQRPRLAVKHCLPVDHLAEKQAPM